MPFPQVCRLANHFVTQHTHLQFIHGRGVQPILTHAKADEMVISDHLLLLVLGQVCTHTVGHAFLGPDRIKPRKDLRGLGFEICTASTWIHGACPFLFKRRAFIIDFTLFMKKTEKMLHIIGNVVKIRQLINQRRLKNERIHTTRWGRDGRDGYS